MTACEPDRKMRSLPRSNLSSSATSCSVIGQFLCEPARLARHADGVALRQHSVCRQAQVKRNRPPRENAQCRRLRFPAQPNDARRWRRAWLLTQASLRHRHGERYPEAGKAASSGSASLPPGWPASSGIGRVERPDDQRPVGQQRSGPPTRSSSFRSSAEGAVGPFDRDRHLVGPVLHHAAQWRAFDRRLVDVRPDLLAHHDRLAAGRVLEACHRRLAFLDRLQRLRD